MSHESIPDDPSTYDYGSDADPDAKAVAKAFADLDRLTLAALRATEARKSAEAELERAKKVEDQLLAKDIPALLESMRMDKCTTASGIDVSVKREIKASLPGHDRTEARAGAIHWLIEKGHGGVVKNAVRVDLDRGQDARANELVVDLRARGFEVEQSKDVHAGTLSKLVRELMGEGTIVPKELFNLFDLKVAKLTRRD